MHKSYPPLALYYTKTKYSNVSFAKEITLSSLCFRWGPSQTRVQERQNPHRLLLLLLHYDHTDILITSLNMPCSKATNWSEKFKNELVGNRPLIKRFANWLLCMIFKYFWNNWEYRIIIIFHIKFSKQAFIVLPNK